MVCAMQELNTAAVAVSDTQHHHHHHHHHHQQQLHHQQNTPHQQVEIRAITTGLNGPGIVGYGNSQHAPQMTTIVLLTTPPSNIQMTHQSTALQPQQQQQQQQQHHHLQQQSQPPQIIVNQTPRLPPAKSQQLKKQHASLVKLLESAPITKKSGEFTKKQASPQLNVALQLQQQRPQHAVYLPPQQPQQQHQQQQLAQPKRLKGSQKQQLQPQHGVPPTTLKSDTSNHIKTLTTSTTNNLKNNNNANNNCRNINNLNPTHQVTFLTSLESLKQAKNDSETGKKEEDHQHNVENKDNKSKEKTHLETTTTNNLASVEPQQCPWKKIRYARELKQKEQMEKRQQEHNQEQQDQHENDELQVAYTCDIKENYSLDVLSTRSTTISKNSNSNCNSNTSSNSNSSSNTTIKQELNLAEQTHKEIAILLQQQHQNYQQQLQQQRRDSSDSNSSLLSASSANNGCTCLSIQSEKQEKTIIHKKRIEDTVAITQQQQQHHHQEEHETSHDRIVVRSRRSSLVSVCDCMDCHIDVIDAGCEDEHLCDEIKLELCSEHIKHIKNEKVEQNTLNYLCQKFDENLETSHHNHNHGTSAIVMMGTPERITEQTIKMEAPDNNAEKMECEGSSDKEGIDKDEGFFRRSIQQKIQYRPCTKNQQCSILRINRNRCQYCRLKKCIAVGMSRDAVRFGRVPKREKARILAAMQQSTQNRGQQRALASELDDQPRLLSAVLRAHLETCEFTKEKVAAMRQRARECPSYSMPTLLACPLNPAPELQSEQEFSQRFAHVIRGVIDFAGMIPGFQLLSQDDKFTLLKAGLFDALFVRLICMFDSSINSIICLNGQVMRRDAIQNGANARFLVDSTFNFAERMNSMNLSDAEIGLFCAIVLITPDRPGLRNIELIEKMYSRLKGCLQTIINQNRPDQPEFMSKLLETMPDLRTLSTLHTEKLVVFRTEHKELLRQQMWTMDEEQLSASKSPSGWEDNRMDVEAKSPLGSVSSTESGDLEYQTSSTTPATTHHIHRQPSSLASSAPLLAATLSGTCPLRTRANSGSSGDSNADLDLVGSHAHLAQNGLTITPIVRAHSHQQLHHHLSVAPAQHRYRKLDSPTDSGIESGNEKNECGNKVVSSGGSSSCSSPRSSVDDALDCTDGSAANNSQVTVSVSPVRSPQPTTAAPSSTSNSSSSSGSTTSTSSSSTLKRQIVEDMPVLKRVLQAPPLYDTNSLMDEAYKPHKKFRALRHREYETAEADASSSTSANVNTTSCIPTAANSPVQQSIAAANNAQSPPPPAATLGVTVQNQVMVVPQAAASPVVAPTVSSPPAITHHQSQLHMHLTRPIPTNSSGNTNGNTTQQPIQQQQQQPSSLSSTHSVLAKSLMAEPRMTPEQIKRSDIIQNYIMRDAAAANNSNLLVCSPHATGNRSPAPQHSAVAGGHHAYAAGSSSPASSNSPNSNCASPSTTTVTSMASPPPSGAANRWPGHSVITTTSINQRQQSVSPSSNGSSSSSSTSNSSSASNASGCQYFQSPHSTSASVSPPRPSPSAMNTPPRLLELQVEIADSQQPLNLSKKSPTPPPSKLQALVAAATAAQRYPPAVSADVTVTATTASSASVATTTGPASTSPQVQVHKVMLEA